MYNMRRFVIGNKLFGVDDHLQPTEMPMDQPKHSIVQTYLAGFLVSKSALVAGRSEASRLKMAAESSSILLRRD
jgi:hypothetical protein